MRTDDLADMLANNAATEPHQKPGLIWIGGVTASAAACTVAMLAWPGLNPAGLGWMVATPAWWGKAGFGLALSIVGLVAAVSLAQPGRGRRLLLWALVPLGLMWAVAVAQLLGAPNDQRLALVLGGTWRVCARNVAALSIPAFVIALWILRRMAPTQPMSAGAAAGLFAGGLGALVYAFHCPELAPAFVAVWYVLGIAIPTTLGAVLGPRLLRW